MIDRFNEMFADGFSSMRFIDSRRVEVVAYGMTIIARIDGKEIRRDATLHLCELEEIRMSTWHYQVLTDELRESLGHMITIVE